VQGAPLIAPGTIASLVGIKVFAGDMENHDDNSSATCRRCGTCCEQGGPALHLEDRQLIAAGHLSPLDLVAVRAGEPAQDPRLGRVAPAPHEFLKMAGVAGGWCCRFFDREHRGCGIYRHRPLECRLLFCRDTGPVEEVIGRDLLVRRQLLAPDDPVLALLARQEREIDYQMVLSPLADHMGRQEGGAALARLNTLVRADLALRQDFLRLFPARERQELFLLGRPLFLVLAPYGFRLSQGRAGVSLQFIPGNKEK
jgi:Fe-S-cluster containining protein